MSGLTFGEFGAQLHEYRLLLSYLGPVGQVPKAVRIRDEWGDSVIAAVHIEDDVLIFDMGQSVEEAQP